jgi:hypothetical protein
MSINVLIDEPMDGRIWTIQEPAFEGMGWHVTRLEDDGITLTTLAVADNEQQAIDHICRALFPR